MLNSWYNQPTLNQPLLTTAMLKDILNRSRDEVQLIEPGPFLGLPFGLEHHAVEEALQELKRVQLEQFEASKEYTMFAPPNFRFLNN